MNNTTCSKCGRPFQMGVTGIYTDNGDLCDGCAGAVRDSKGRAWERGEQAQVYWSGNGTHTVTRAEAFGKGTK